MFSADRFVLLFIVLSLSAGCGRETSRQVPPIRDAIAVRYVARADAPLRTEPAGAAKVLHRFTLGETVSVLSTKGEWSEIRFGDGSGWMASTDLTDSAEAARQERGTTEIKFRKAPSPVYSQARVRGEIVLEAVVAESGVITEVRTLRNTTGSVPLEMLNRGELLRASFYPLLVNGKPKPFVYEYRVSY